MIDIMKFASFSLACLLSVSSLFAAEDKQDLGKIMFVGDSITHGHSSASYRWALHKLFTDNKMSYESLGIMTGNQQGTVGNVDPDTSYAGVAFTNVHSAQSSARAWEIVGRKEGPRFNGTNIMNWLGQADTTCSAAAYSDATYVGDDAPQYFFMMIGTNDMLSDHGNDLEANAKTVVPDLQKDVDGIIKCMRKANKDARITLTTIPVWSDRKGVDAAGTHTTVEKYNEALKKSAKAKKITVVEINKGLQDPSEQRPFHGHADLFAKDGLHPNDQGSLIIAGNIAQSMGWAGRTMGLERKAASEFSVSFAKDKNDFTLNQAKTKGASILLSCKAGSSISYHAADTKLMSVEMNVRFGDGAKKGWSADDSLSITLGNEGVTGCLTVTESYLKWGERVIFCGDMAKLSTPLRMSYVAGDAKAGIAAGFYIWLGDMLVGEALEPLASEIQGLKIECQGKASSALISGLSISPETAYAPALPSAAAKR